MHLYLLVPTLSASSAAIPVSGDVINTLCYLLYLGYSTIYVLHELQMPREFQARQTAWHFELPGIERWYYREKRVPHCLTGDLEQNPACKSQSAIWIQPLRDYNYWLTLLVIPGQRIMQSQPLYTLGLGQNVSVYHLLKMITLLISISLFSPAFQNKTKQRTSHPLALNNSKRQQCLGLMKMKYRAVHYQHTSGITVHFDSAWIPYLGPCTGY